MEECGAGSSAGAEIQDVPIHNASSKASQFFGELEIDVINNTGICHLFDHFVGIMETGH